MKARTALYLVIASLVLAGSTGLAEESMKTVYDFTVKDIDGNDVSLKTYDGKVLMIVNVASKFRAWCNDQHLSDPGDYNDHLHRRRDSL